MKEITSQKVNNMKIKTTVICEITFIEDIDDKDNDVHYYRKDGTHAYERINGREDIQQYKQTDGKHNDILDYPVFVKNKSKYRYHGQHAESESKQSAHECVSK